MSDTDLGFYLPRASIEKNKGETWDIVHEALIYLLGNTGLKYYGETDSLILGVGKQRNVLVILSTYEENLKKYIKEILKYGYGKDYLKDTRLGKQRYLFIDLGNRTFLFDSLLSILASLKLANAETPERIFNGIHKVQKSFDPETNSITRTISSKDLQDHIEQSCLPSGAEEIQEMLFRDVLKAHELFSSLKGESYALRLLLGAFFSGDINLETMKQTISQISPDYKFPIAVLNWLEKIEGRKNLKINEKNLSPLPDYLANRNILVIEDRLKDDHWDIVLPVLLGGTKWAKRLEQPNANQESGGSRLFHAIDARNALETYKDNLRKFDIILLDLLSSAKKAEGQTGHGGQTLLTLGLSVKELTEKIKDLYFDQAREGNLVPFALPQVVVFSVDSTGVTARTLLKELGAVDYFFKTTQGEPHKRAYHASFRNALIKALKDTASHVSGIPYSDKVNRFDDWLRQFFPRHRPIIVRLMKHFRYYSAPSIVKLLDNYLENVRPLAKGSEPVLHTRNQIPLNRFVFSYLGRANKSGPATLALFSKTDWAKKCVQIAKENMDKEQRAKYAPFRTYDDLIDFLSEELSEGPKENLRVLVIDDVVGSGGQLKSYLWKLINRDLRKAFMNIKHSFETWKEHCKTFLLSQEGEPNRKRIEIHAIGVIGLIKPNKTLDIRYHEEKYLQDDLEPDSMKIALPPKYLWEKKDPWESMVNMVIDGDPVHFSGVLKVPLCLDPDHHKEPEDDEKGCKCEKVIRVYVHIADFNQNVGMVCEKEGIDYSKLRSILSEYVYVTSPRTNEYPCDFEPFGWKECGGLFSTYANCPGNTLPIIWGNRDKIRDPKNIKNGHLKKWEPLFPRFFNPMDEGKAKERKKLYCSEKRKCYLCPDLRDIYVGEDNIPCQPRQFQKNHK